MSLHRIEFEKLGATRLFLDYLAGRSDLMPHYQCHPSGGDAELHGLADRVSRTHRAEVRERVVGRLRELHRAWQAPKASLDSLAQLSRGDALCVVAGQQLNLLGGPLFTAYKALDAVLEARRAAERLGRPVVPVFWLADEDHDLDEILPIGIPAAESVDGPGFRRHAFPRDAWHAAERGGPVGRMPVPDTLPDFLDRMVREVPEAPFAEIVRQTLHGCHRPGRSLREAFGRVLLQWFGPMGLVLMVGDEPAFKQASADLFARSVRTHHDLHEALLRTGHALREGGRHEQVAPTHGHLFHLFDPEAPDSTASGEHPAAQRLKIRRTQSHWQAAPAHGAPISWSDAELQEAIERRPEAFSPDALLRLGYQSRLLPVLHVITGPAETAYYAQARPLFETLGLPMPMVLPRHSLTLVSPASERRLERVPFDPVELRGDLQALRKAWVRQLSDPDPEALLAEASSRIAGLDGLLTPWLEQVDPTLTATQQRMRTRMEAELDRLRRKMYRSLIRREEHAMRRLERLREALYPSGGWQEREVSAFTLVARQGEGVWNRLLERMAELPADAHHLLRM